MQNNFADNHGCSSHFSIVKTLNFSAHPVSHKHASNFHRSCFPTTLSKFIEYYFEGSLLCIQGKTSANNHRCVFHLPEFNASDFL